MSGYVSDNRRHNFFIIDNEIIDEYMSAIGVYGFAVYSYLVKMSNVKNTCYPAFATIAKDLGISRPTVVKAIKALANMDLISVEHQDDEKGGQTSNLYTILPLQKTTPVNEVNGGDKSGLPRIRPNEQETLTNVSDAGASSPTNWFTHYCERASEVGLVISDEDRKRLPANLKRISKMDGVSIQEMYRLTSHLISRRLAGVVLSPQDALNDIRGVPRDSGNGHRKPDTQTIRRTKKVIS